VHGYALSQLSSLAVCSLPLLCVPVLPGLGPLFQRRKQSQFLEAECIDIDPVKKTVRCKEVFPVQQGKGEEFELRYDDLVVAVGAETNTFNTPGVKEHCHFLKVRVGGAGCGGWGGGGVWVGVGVGAFFFPHPHALGPKTLNPKP